MSTTERIQSFEEFWPFYASEHSKPLTRWLHFAGTTMALGIAGTAVLTGNPWLLPAALVAGYGPAWIGHFFVEKNRPASFKYPLWSFRADFVMYAKMWTGKMTAEVERALEKHPPRERELRNGVAA